LSKRVVVGLSGGVDSSVAAFLLKEQGYDVIGVFMKNWHDSEFTISNECPWEEDSKDALLVAEKLGIPFQTLDLSDVYLKRIVNYMFDEYEKGRTPNPDVLCNREIKFDVFLEHAMKLGADFVATGHYCSKKENPDGTFSLIAGQDKNKDQSYFLCQVNQFQLSKALFPLGELEKSEVRKIAEEQGLVTAQKRDSQGLCFIGKVKLPEFLKQKLKEKSGDVVLIPESTAANDQHIEKTKSIIYQPENGKMIGTHRGAHFYTIGQRKGLNIGGFSEPLFVLQIDTNKNVVYVGEGEQHPGLWKKGLFIKNNEVHWVNERHKLTLGQVKKYMVRIRYRQILFPVTLIQKEKQLNIIFDNPQKAVAKGQFAVWYDGDELIGSGVIG